MSRLLVMWANFTVKALELVFCIWSRKSLNWRSRYPGTVPWTIHLRWSQLDREDWESWRGNHNQKVYFSVTQCIYLLFLSFNKVLCKPCVNWNFLAHEILVRVSWTHYFRIRRNIKHSSKFLSRNSRCIQVHMPTTGNGSVNGFLLSSKLYELYVVC